MDNQHKKIKGYRDLDQAEIDLMNRIKTHAGETEKLLQEVRELREIDYDLLPKNPVILPLNEQAESLRCIDQAQPNLQQGYMWLVRAVALPQSF